MSVKHQRLDSARCITPLHGLAGRRELLSLQVNLFCWLQAYIDLCRERHEFGGLIFNYSKLATVGIGCARW